MWYSSNASFTGRAVLLIGVKPPSFRYSTVKEAFFGVTLFCGRLVLY